MVRPILDIYDDPTGSILVRLVPDAEHLPDEIKQASIVTGTEPDEDFALLMIGEGGRKLRKFACTDPGNTVLSMLYFMESKGRLPEDLRKTAAWNLRTACRYFDITPPEPLCKEAGEEEDPGYKLVYFDEAYRESPTELAPVHFSAAGGHLPLDTLEEVKQACAWFDDIYLQIHPVKRRELALDIEKRAGALGITIPASMRPYVGYDYAPGFQAHVEVRQSLLNRAAEEMPQDKLSEHAPKLAALRGYDTLLHEAGAMPAENFAHALRKLDEAYGLHEYWDDYLVDPYAAVLTKRAEAEYEYTDGVDKVTATDLERTARNHKPLLQRTFPTDMVEGFCKDPVGIFASLPKPQKKIMMRLAQDNDFPGVAL